MSFEAKLKNNKIYKRTRQKLSDARPQKYCFLMEHNAADARREVNESRVHKSGAKRLSNEPSTEHHQCRQRDEIVKPHRCRAQIARAARFTKSYNYSLCPSFIQRQSMIKALRKQIKPIILIFPVSSHGSWWRLS